MKQVVLVKAETPEEFVDVFNETCASLSRDSIDFIHLLRDCLAYIFYDTNDEAEQIVNDLDGRHCCECANYEWKRTCSLRPGIIEKMDPACSFFTDEKPVENKQ